jgi:ABC-2 type transport system permease protein
VSAIQPGSREAVLTVIGYAIRESVRRRVLAVVFILTLGFLALYGIGVHFAFRDTQGFAGFDVVDTKAFTGATLLGLAMFATLFLGAVVAVFLTLGVVRGDAETGLLQPLVVRPLGWGWRRAW